MTMLTRLVKSASLALSCCTSVAAAAYPDGRPVATLRMDAVDQGVVLRHGDGPSGCDAHGARDLWVYEDRGTYYMNYDGAGPTGWLACLATSGDLVHWTKKGPVLSLGAPGEPDSASASYGTTYNDNGAWHMFYLGTPHASGPGRVPSFPYLTLAARGSSPAGPWVKQRDVVPFAPRPGTYYDTTASPGQIVKQGADYLMFFSASGRSPLRRTIGIARTRDLDGPWQVDAAPIVPPAEQVENTSLYYEASIKTWFLFTNHIGLAPGRGEYTDAVWVYWSRTLDHWNPDDKAVVIDGRNCKWSPVCIGLPGVVRRGNRLAVLYDGPGGSSSDHMNRDIGLAWLGLPLRVPTSR
jgi:predicted GH43/DUF377 family glycosyl hydrolase